MQKIKINDKEEKIVPITTNPLFTQKLKDLTPRCSLACAFIFLSVATTLFVIFGIAIIVECRKIKEVSINYTDCKIDSNNECSLTINVPELMTAPVYLYYNLSSFYSNHRDFSSSRDYNQLRASSVGFNDTVSKCSGAMSNLEMQVGLSYQNVTLNPYNLAWPCGLSAKAFFNDTFSLSANSSSIPINQTDIANYYDKTYAFISPVNSTDISWINIKDNEHFIVWMETESWKNFRKIWGRINQDMPPGIYTIKIKSVFPATTFNTEKGIVLGTASPLGWASFLGWFLIAGAIFSVFSMIVLLICKPIRGNKFDVKYQDLTW